MLPKGSIFTHKNMCHLMHWTERFTKQTLPNISGTKFSIQHLGENHGYMLTTAACSFKWNGKDPKVSGLCCKNPESLKKGVASVAHSLCTIPEELRDEMSDIKTDVWLCKAMNMRYRASCAARLTSRSRSYLMLTRMSHVLYQSVLSCVLGVQWDLTLKVQGQELSRSRSGLVHAFSASVMATKVKNLLHKWLDTFWVDLE